MMLLDTLSNFVMLIMRVQQVPLMSIKSSTMGSTASTIIVHQNWHGACLCLYTISLIQIDLKWFQGDQYALRHPQRPCQPQPLQFQQVPVMFMKIWHGTCLYTVSWVILDKEFVAATMLPSLVPTLEGRISNITNSHSFIFLENTFFKK